jgi:hypothetical protein
VITVLVIPILYFYSQGKAFENHNGYGLLMFSLGNLGQAESQCHHQFVGIDKEFEYNCQNGKISELVHFGLIPNNN